MSPPPPVRLVPEARDEFDVAVDWYDHQRPGLGTVLLDRVREVFAGIAANPKKAHKAMKAHLAEVVAAKTGCEAAAL
jgi:hypothetical protein